MSNTLALAGAGDVVGAELGMHQGVEGLTRMRGQWHVECYTGKGWRGVLTRLRTGLHRIADLYTRDEGRWLRQLGNFIARPARKWEDDIENIVVNAGLTYLLDIGLSGGTQITSWYLGLTDGTPTVAAGDTMASHVGWAEVTAYDEAARQAWTDGGVSSQSIDNSGSAATFTIDTNSTTVGGAFLTSVNTKGVATGTLYAAGAFTAGDKSLDDNDTLTVTATFTAAAA